MTNCVKSVTLAGTAQYPWVLRQSRYCGYCRWVLQGTVGTVGTAQYPWVLRQSWYCGYCRWGLQGTVGTAGTVQYLQYLQYPAVPSGSTHSTVTAAGQTGTVQARRGNQQGEKTNPRYLFFPFAQRHTPVSTLLVKLVRQSLKQRRLIFKILLYALPFIFFS